MSFILTLICQFSGGPMSHSSALSLRRFAFVLNIFIDSVNMLIWNDRWYSSSFLLSMTVDSQNVSHQHSGIRCRNANKPQRRFLSLPTTTMNIISLTFMRYTMQSFSESIYRDASRNQSHYTKIAVPGIARWRQICGSLKWRNGPNLQRKRKRQEKRTRQGSTISRPLLLLVRAHWSLKWWPCRAVMVGKSDIISDVVKIDYDL